MSETVILIGNLGRDPETRVVGDNSVCNFSIGVRSEQKVRGEEKPLTHWYKIAAWGKLGELCQRYLEKGRQVQVIGGMVSDEGGNPESYTTKEGEFRTSFSVRADRVSFLNGGAGAGGSTEDPAGSDYEDEDDIPF